MKIERIINGNTTLKGAAEDLTKLMEKNGLEPEPLPYLVSMVKKFKMCKPEAVAFMEWIEKAENARQRKNEIEVHNKTNPVQYLQGEIDAINETIAVWAEEFKKDPFDKLQWADGIVARAAKRKVYLEVMNYLTEFVKGDPEKWLVTVNELTKIALQKASCPARSTSPSSNNAETYLMEAYANLARSDYSDRTISWISHWFRKEAEFAGEVK